MYPITVDVLAVHDRVTECETACCTPVPDSVIVAGELVALLLTCTDPGMRPVPDGAKVTVRVADFPACTIWPDWSPLAVYPAPDTVTLEIVTLEFPALVKTTGRLLLLPMLTLEKFRLVWLGFRMSVATALTVNVAAELVMLPAELVTVTVNCAPLSEVVVAGVV